MKSALLIMILLVLLLAGVLYYRVKGPMSSQQKTVQKKVPVVETKQAETNKTNVTTATVREIPLDIISPELESVTDKTSILVQGKTAPNASVFINDLEIKADATGNFSQNVTLEEGENALTIVAHDENGLFAEEEITVTVVK